MKLTEHDLKQINNETLDRLSSDQVLFFTKTLLSDLKEAMDRLNLRVASFVYKSIIKIQATETY